jgi:hypothetical protein
MKLTPGSPEFSLDQLSASIGADGRVVYMVGAAEVAREDFSAIRGWLAAEELRTIAHLLGPDSERSICYRVDDIAEQLRPDVEGTLANQLLYTLRARGD